MLRARHLGVRGGTSCRRPPGQHQGRRADLRQAAQVWCRAMASTCAVATAAQSLARRIHWRALSGCALCHSAETSTREMRRGVTRPRFSRAVELRSQRRSGPLLSRKDACTRARGFVPVGAAEGELLGDHSTHGDAEDVGGAQPRCLDHAAASSARSPMR